MTTIDNVLEKVEIASRVALWIDVEGLAFEVLSAGLSPHG